MAEQNRNNENIIGEPLPAESLYVFAEINETAIQSAILWWREVASLDWQDVLDKEPIETDA